jgi:tetratricopeptide (TPR) repeat protein
VKLGALCKKLQQSISKRHFQELKNYEAAIEDLKRALEMDPNNKALSSHLNQGKTKLKDSNLQLSQGLKKMFL